jgi:hypothetical protein
MAAEANTPKYIIRWKGMKEIVRPILLPYFRSDNTSSFLLKNTTTAVISLIHLEMIAYLPIDTKFVIMFYDDNKTKRSIYLSEEELTSTDIYERLVQEGASKITELRDRLNKEGDPHNTFFVNVLNQKEPGAQGGRRSSTKRRSKRRQVTHKSVGRKKKSYSRRH